ncbi:MAG: UDP-N-acetylmuramoyl-L-alanyl-D-glutamate--2,6-diaminopimelate ligase [Bacteroidales bacterium]|nr:UDP-N-acetylmuramoyl-L-alanyl-D-glutamate--2,6-diaminopimelate ligase [Bacteroidales bacterium]
MAHLNKIIEGLDVKVTGNENVDIKRLVFDSRIARSGDLFVAQKGWSGDGHQYIPQVIAAGVNCILCENLPADLQAGVTYIQSNDTHRDLGLAASNFYGRPSSNFKLIGVTGTNGKTSIATLLYRMFTNLGHKAGLLSTVCNYVGAKKVESTHTTPDAVSLNALLAEMAGAGCSYVFMEVSSHAVDQKRIAGLEFDGGIFTNITHDHLDYHKTFDAYIKAKKSFFDGLPSSAFALVNLDDKRASVMVQNTTASKNSYALHSIADFKGKVIESHFDGTLMQINSKEVWIKLIGQFNASNLLAVFSTACLLKQEPDEVLKQLSMLETVDGRFEYVRSQNGITAVVDYAHTPDALKNVIDTINQIRQGGAQLITVVGAGGNRDKTKRPEMARISANGSDKLILTSDNPRFEEPQDILNDMLAGVGPHLMKKVLSIVDRREAIRTAVMMASPGDTILIAGKGHETYQDVKGQKSHFSDKEVVAEIFMLNQVNPQ